MRPFHNPFTDAYAEIEYLEQQLQISQERTRAQLEQQQSWASHLSSAARSRPTSAARSRPSSAARSRPTSATRSRPTSAASGSSEYEYYNGYGLDRDVDSINTEESLSSEVEAGVKLPQINTKNLYK